MQEQALALQLFLIKKGGLTFLRKPSFTAGRIERRNLKNSY